MEIVLETLPSGNTIERVVYGGMAFHTKTPIEVANALITAFLAGKRIRIFFGDTDTGRDWCEEHDVMGYVRHSGGRIRIPLLLHNSRSRGGGAILDHCVVKIVGTRSKQVWYQHPKYHAPAFTISKPPKKIGKVNLLDIGCVAGVYRDGVNAANFKSHEQAKRWIAFMLGERMAK